LARTLREFLAGFYCQGIFVSFVAGQTELARFSDSAKKNKNGELKEKKKLQCGLSPAKKINSHPQPTFPQHPQSNSKKPCLYGFYIIRPHRKNNPNPYL